MPNRYGRPRRGTQGPVHPTWLEPRGHGFGEGIEVFLDGLLAEDIEVHSNYHLSFKAPDELTLGDIELVIRINGESAVYNVVYKCGYSVCSSELKNEGCFF